MNRRSFVTVPIYIVGLSTILLGIRWMLSPEPWLLDQHANEVVLQMSFVQLFAADVNTNLPAYLTVIYRFFGWWVISIGSLISAYTFATGLETKRSQSILHGLLSLIVIVAYIMILNFIPSSPFIYAVYGLAAMILVSFLASTKLPSDRTGG
ncbi:MAG: hypothetical protein R3307_01105 [Anaerolineales bacterium]|nr:hypothetical protein [Anaerolineales bacterium]